MNIRSLDVRHKTGIPHALGNTRFRVLLVTYPSRRPLPAAAGTAASRQLFFLLTAMTAAEAALQDPNNA